MVVGEDVCLRRLSKGDRALEVRFNRFLGNTKVTAEGIIESWSESTVAAREQAEGRDGLVAGHLDPGLISAARDGRPPRQLMLA